ncbi:MAG: hypothetical protein MRQ11_02520 [Candidatus Midichloria mitochondrii]|uniref:hypothetical protein n=1 Tax=Candidatus Midichloria mitochondrii TaxID=234827 RepID=UPI0011D1AD32|nr:hypothetical protein [Candidatus Midichloria mitochondrii]MDJ1312810.1 hypothetical protein [Candidatus Midichloria mitochondrii]MDJ1583555.1 hypothetical protein [Candidatus Midichloria mitochondrii]
MPKLISYNRFVELIARRSHHVGHSAELLQRPFTLTSGKYRRSSRCRKTDSIFDGPSIRRSLLYRYLQVYQGYCPR